MGKGMEITAAKTALVQRSRDQILSQPGFFSWNLCKIVPASYPGSIVHLLTSVSSKTCPYICFKRERRTWLIKQKESVVGPKQGISYQFIACLQSSIPYKTMKLLHLHFILNILYIDCPVSSQLCNKGNGTYLHDSVPIRKKEPGQAPKRLLCSFSPL